MLSLCLTPVLGTPLCASDALCGVVRPAYVQVRRRSPVPARVTSRRPCAGVWSMDLALRMLKHHIVIAGQNVFMAACGPYWSVKRGPDKSKVYQRVFRFYQLMVRVRGKSFARMRVRMYAHMRTRVSMFFSILSYGPRTSSKKVQKTLLVNGFQPSLIADHSRTGTDLGAA